MCFTLHHTINWAIGLEGKACHMQLMWPLHAWHRMKRPNYPSSILKKGHMAPQGLTLLNDFVLKDRIGAI